MNPPAFLWRRRVRVLEWNESGFETGPRLSRTLICSITLILRFDVRDGILQAIANGDVP